MHAVYKYKYMYTFWIEFLFVLGTVSLVDMLVFCVYLLKMIILGMQDNKSSARSLLEAILYSLLSAFVCYAIKLRISTLSGVRI